MNKLNDFQEAIKYVGGAGCLMMMGGVVIVIMMIESHLRSWRSQIKTCVLRSY